MSKQFFSQQRFLPYFCTQFLGAFNDSLYKNALLIFIAYRLVVENQGILLNLAAIALILPFVLLASIAGQLADKYEKSLLIRRIKISEVIIVSFGCLALYLESVYFMLAVLFALGTQSAFFGPIKYSILPQHLKKEELLSANAYVEAATFISILLGTILGGFLVKDIAYEKALIGLLVIVSLGGVFMSRRIPNAPPASPNLKISFNIWRGTAALIKEAWANRPVFLSILAISWFWFFGSIILTQFPSFAEIVLRGDANVATLMLATFSIGIGLGSFTCSYLSSGRIELGLILVGAIGISFFTWQFSNTEIPASAELKSLTQMLATPGIWVVIFNMIMIAFFCGLYIVPLYTFMQIHSDDANRSRIIAANNFLNCSLMVVAGILAVVMISLGFSVLQIFKVATVLNLLVAIVIFTVIPQFFLRLVSWLLVHSVYRISKQDLHNIPESGPAILVCNHVSFIDPAIIFGVSKRPIRFVMHNAFYQLPLAKYLFRALKAIPITSAKENPAVMQSALHSVTQALQNGELVCIFPEGGISHDGEIAKFQSGVEHLLKREPVPVIPLALRGLWGTWFSRYRGRAMKGLPTSFMKRLTVVAGEAIAPNDADRHTLRERVLNLRGDER